MGKYIDLKSDFGFKFCMQDETIMKSFLNAILDGDCEKITSVKFENVESPRYAHEGRGVIFDLLCTTETGDHILIEMQNSTQRFFKTRSSFYVYNLMRRKFKKGFQWSEMREDISRIMGIFIVGRPGMGLTKVLTRTAECDLDTGKEFWDRMRKYFVSLPHFEFDRKDITTRNIWIYFFKNLGNMEFIDPSVYERADEGLRQLIKRAEVGALSEKEYDQYEASMKLLADEIDMEKQGYERGMADGMQQGIAQGMQQGIAQGMQQGIAQVAKEMKQNKMPMDVIMEVTHLTKEEIDNL
jgi:predicted transposase/invertase (TIGR01784 family)